MIKELKEIQREKTMTNEHIGTEFARLPVKAPEMSNENMQHIMSNLLGGEYGQEVPPDM